MKLLISLLLNSFYFNKLYTFVHNNHDDDVCWCLNVYYIIISKIREKEREERGGGVKI